MKYGISLAAILIIAIIEVTVLKYFGIFGIKPDLLLIYAVFSLFYFPKRLAIFSLVASGLFKDIFSGVVFGTNILFFCIWSIIILRLSKSIYQDSPAFRTIAVFIITLVNSLAFYGLNLFYGESLYLSLPWFFFRVSFLEALYTTLISMAVFRYFRRYIVKNLSYTD